MDADLHDRVAAALAAAGLEDAVACIHTPGQLGTTLWELILTDQRHGRDVLEALAQVPGVTGTLLKTEVCIRFDMDRTIPG